MWQKIITMIGYFPSVHFNFISHLEKIISTIGSFVGVFIVIFISRYFVNFADNALIIASIGASAILIFAVPHGALSQPWAVLGGHCISAFIGVSCYRFIPQFLLAAPTAVAIATLAMYYLRCMHPPGGATALTAVIGSEHIHALGYQYVMTPIFLNVVILLSSAVVFNYFFKWRRYPPRLMQKWSEPTEKTTSAKNESLSSDNLKYALEKMDSFIDVTEEDLKKIFSLATDKTKSKDP